MNPEEGQLRPQLLDRFGLCVETAAVRDQAGRVAILRALEAFEADPRAYAASDGPGAGQPGCGARGRALRLVSGGGPGRTGQAAGRGAGGRGGSGPGSGAEILLSRAARAHAAWDNRPDAGPDDVGGRGDDFVLCHRRRQAAPPRPPQSSPPPARVPRCAAPPGADTAKAVVRRIRKRTGRRGGRWRQGPGSGP